MSGSNIIVLVIILFIIGMILITAAAIRFETPPDNLIANSSPVSTTTNWMGWMLALTGLFLIVIAIGLGVICSSTPR